MIQQGDAQIFASDIAAAALMTSSKSQMPWDLTIKKVNGIIYIDKRLDVSIRNVLNYETVSETA